MRVLWGKLSMTEFCREAIAREVERGLRRPLPLSISDAGALGGLGAPRTFVDCGSA